MIPAPDAWWTVLGVGRSASIDEIHQAYRRKAATAHPNAGGDRADWDRLADVYSQAKAAR